jgi:Protein of unknown function (DUF3089)
MHPSLRARARKRARASAAVAALVAALALVGALAAGASAKTTWLCRPGQANNPCLSREEATIELGNGTSFVEHARPAKDPPIDCFYVYPTVSGQTTRNATVAVEPEETQIAIDQASRLSQVCKVYAPVYPQLTIAALNRGEFTPEGVAEAYIGVATAFAEYMALYNHGRGVVLVGHSQGAGMLIRLIREQIDPVPALRRQLVSAVLLGGNVTVPDGGTVGGSFANIPACSSVIATGCVVAYSSFEQQPPPGALFGRSESPLTALGGSPSGPGYEVLCVNPTVLAQAAGATGPLLSYTSTTPFPGPLGAVVQVPKAPTPWVGTPDEYSARCERAAGANWLQVTPAGPPGDPREPVLETLGPLWGTHLADVNLALGNIVGLVGAQSVAYQLGSIR